MNQRLVVVVSALALAGCGTGAPGVAVRRISSNIEFGVSTTTTSSPLGAAAPQSVAPANLTLPGQVPAFDFATTTTYNFSSPAYVPTSVTSTADQGQCPEPPYGASPDRSVALSVAQPPTQGSYKWQIIDSQPVSGTNFTLKTYHYVTYVIDNVTKTTTTPNPVPGDSATTVFDYDVITPGSEGGTVTTTYEVKQNAPEVSGSAGNVGQTQHVGSPDRGLSLVSVVDRNGSGAMTASFHPSTPVLLFPLDVASPQSFNAAGVDPSNGASFTNQATASGQTTRVNACGQLVDGWSVTSTQSFSQNGSTDTSTVDYAVATQYGGIIISSASTPTGSSQTETDEIGQLKPGPLPPGRP